MRNDRDTHDSLAAYRHAASAAPILDPDTERMLIERFQKGCQVSLQKLLASHLRLVLSMAKRYTGHGAAMEDLISEGNLGLVEAARRFEAERGNRFGTYAAWWVRAHVRRYALSNRRIVSAPSTRNARRILAGLRKTQRDIAQREGRAAERDEVAALLGVPESDVAMVEAALSGRDVAIGPMEDGTTWELPDEEPSPEQLAALEELEGMRQQRVEAALDLLSEREREIVRRRFLQEDSATLAVLGESLGLSRERVRQIEKRAQKKLRNALLDCVA
jgi:RNA polymerase sigma-32 factor